jgi:glycosyltransferase involved in cell wall biosynthesis
MSTLAIICPTLNRADKLPDLVRQVHANTETPHTLYFVMESHDRDSFNAVKGLDCELVVGRFGSCAAAYNAGFDYATEPYNFLANDDLEFPEGWELPALALMDEWPIVGVNEGHNRMTCFSMVRRDFILEQSGVYDKRATLVHPYKSQYVDTELAEYAKHRGVWAEAHEGGVIHRHHDFGEADPNHPNYVKARSTLDEDRNTYDRRRNEWLATQ